MDQYCLSCNRELLTDDRFCRHCGAPRTENRPLASGEEGGDRMSPETASALAYLLGFMSGILFLNWPPYRSNLLVRFHAWQSILLTAPLAILSLSIGLLPGFMAIIAVPLLGLLNFAVFFCWLFAMYKALQGERYHFPIVGNLAEERARVGG